MLYVICDTGYQYLPCYRWYWYLPCYIWHMMPIPVLIMLYLTYGTWHRYLPCHIWYMIYDTDTCHAVVDAWYITLILAMLYVTPDTDTCHAIYDMWYLTPVLVLLHLSLYIRHWFLICHTWHLLLTPGIWYAFMWYKYLDLTSWPLTGHYYPWYLYDIFMIITVTGTWHDYYIIITRYLVLLSSCTPVYLNPWNREAPDITPDTILLLTP